MDSRQAHALANPITDPSTWDIADHRRIEQQPDGVAVTELELQQIPPGLVVADAGPSGPPRRRTL